MTNTWCRGEKGGSRLKTVMALAILFAMVFCGIKIVPIYVNNYELQDSINQEATYASVNRKTADDIRADLQKKLQDINVAVDPASIQVSSFQGNVKISLEYTVPVDLAVYQLQLHFHPHADNASL
jgi:predicted membrane protein